MPAVPEKMLPSETVFASKVAAVPALQYTLLELAPPVRMTFKPTFIFNVVGVRKIQTASEMAPVWFLPPSRVRFPEWTERDSQRCQTNCYRHEDMPSDSDELDMSELGIKIEGTQRNSLCNELVDM